MAVAVAQIEPVQGGPLAFLGTVLVGWLFFSFTAQIAARYLLGDVPWKRALAVGAVPAVTTVALGRYGVVLIAAVSLAVDAAAIHAVYRVRYRTAGLVAVGHYVASVLLAALVAYLLALFSTAPL
jgi:hypothetical protein